METHFEKSRPVWVISSAKVAVVFLPALLLILGSKTWVGEDPVRGLVVIWIANVLMLLMVWVTTRKTSRPLETLGLSWEWTGFKGLLTLFAWSLLVFILAVIAFIIGPMLLPDLVNVPEEADLSRYDFLKGNLPGLAISLLGVYLVSSFGEEVIYRAFLIHHFSSMAEGRKWRDTLAVMFSSAIFGLIHYEWGTMGIIQTTAMGLVMGICYVKLKKRLWILILAHAYMDTILLVQMYLSL